MTHQAEILLEIISIMYILKLIKRKANIINGRLVEQRELMLQNPYIIKEKQCVPPLL